MAARPLTGYQREVAERNADAILDAAEDLQRSQGHVNISAVAVSESPAGRCFSVQGDGAARLAAFR